MAQVLVVQACVDIEEDVALLLAPMTEMRLMTSPLLHWGQMIFIEEE